MAPDSVAQAARDTLLVTVVRMPQATQWYSPLLPTLLGGVLAVLGGIVSHTVQTRSDSRRKRVLAERGLETLIASVITFWAFAHSNNVVRRIAAAKLDELKAMCEGFDRLSDYLIETGSVTFEHVALTFVSTVKVRVSDMSNAEAYWAHRVEQGKFTVEQVIAMRQKAVQDIEQELRLKGLGLAQEFYKRRLSKPVLSLIELEGLSRRFEQHEASGPLSEAPRP